MECFFKFFLFDPYPSFLFRSSNVFGNHVTLLK